jgi:hypothetical protein
MTIAKTLAAGRDTGGKALSPWNFARGDHNFPHGLPRPLFTNDIELRDAYFEKYFGVPAKRLEEIYLSRIERFKSLLKAIRRHGNENARQRMTVLLCGYDARRFVLDAAAERNVPALELSLIRRFLPYIERAEFDRERLQQFRWFLLADRNVTKRHLPGQQQYLMALPPAFEELARWSELSPERQEDLALALFALGSMTGARIVLDVAIKRCPDIQRYYETLDWEADKKPGQSRYEPPTDELSRICLEDRPNALLDFIGKLIGFVNEIHDGDLRRLSYLIARVRRLHDYVSDHYPDILHEYRRSTAKAVENLLLTAESDLADFAEIDGFSAETVVLDYLRELLSLLDAADVETVELIEDQFKQFRSAYSRFVEQAWGSYDRVESLEDEIVRLVDEGAMQNAARIGEITAELQRMRGSLDEIFRPLKEFTPPAVKAAPAPKQEFSPPPSTWPSEEQMIIEELRAERDSLLQDKRLLKEELAQKGREAFQAQARRAETNGLSVPPEDMARRIANLCVATGRFTPAAVLRIIETLHGKELVVVLPSAHEAAKRSEDFRYSERLYKLLTLLVTDYRDALRGGRPDTEARHILGNAYRATESESVKGNRDLSRRRIFRYEGREVPMFQHLGIGVADSTEQTLRVHFHWDAGKSLIVIGYVGPHLDTITTS